MQESLKRRWLAGAGLLGAGVLVGGLLAGTLTASAASPSPAPSVSGGQSAGPGVQENDGIPEAQEHHGGHGAQLDQSGTVTAVGATSVTIKTASGTTTYAVNSSSDIDKNGEAQLSSLAVGDAVRFSLVSGTKTIDKLHAGDEALNRPQPGPDSGTAPSGGTSSSGAGYGA